MPQIFGRKKSEPHRDSQFRPVPPPRPAEKKMADRICASIPKFPPRVSSNSLAKADGKEMADYLMHELEAMKSEIDTPRSVNTSSLSKCATTVSVLTPGRNKEEYFRALNHSAVFRTDQERSTYLFKELEVRFACYTPVQLEREYKNRNTGDQRAGAADGEREAEGGGHGEVQGWS